MTRNRLIRALARYNTVAPDMRRRAKAEAWVLAVLVIAAFVWGALR